MKKILSLISALALSSVALTATAAGEVKLIKEESRSSYYRGFSWESGEFKAHVANLAYSKQVAVHVRKTDGTWYDYPMSFSYSAGNNREVWSAPFSISYDGVNSLPDTGPVIEFALKYTVNGVTYWDNNNGANYKVNRGAGSYLAPGVNVAIGNHTPTVAMSYGETGWGGYITVRNIAPTKAVKVVYTTDNWATSQTVNATYSPGSWTYGYSNTPQPNVMGFEEWSFRIPGVGVGSTIKYAVSYTVNGVTYWDNNLGANYTTVIVPR